MSSSSPGEQLALPLRAEAELVSPTATLGAWPLPRQAAGFPSTRYMGSKAKLLPALWAAIAPLGARTALDLFSGSAAVAYLMKAGGIAVTANDQLHVAHAQAAALVENASCRPTRATAEACLRPIETDRFVERNFAGLYFSDEDNRLIDTIRAHIRVTDDTTAAALLRAALARACLKKRPRGVFTYTGHRYDDGRRDLTTSLADHFVEAVRLLANAVFDNGTRCRASLGQAEAVEATAFDLVYLDPPYFSTRSDNEYVRRYHFIEGLARDWQGVELQAGTKTRKFRAYPTPFRTREGARAALADIFRRFSQSHLVLSYSSNCLPDRRDLECMMRAVKRRVEVIPVAYRYSFGTQHQNATGNAVTEYIFVGTD